MTFLLVLVCSRFAVAANFRQSMADGGFGHEDSIVEHSIVQLKQGLLVELFPLTNLCHVPHPERLL